MTDINSSYANCDKMYLCFKRYKVASTPHEKDALWGDILDLARSGECGITPERISSCFLYNLVGDPDPSLALSFFEALPPKSKQQSLAWKSGSFGPGETVLMRAAATLGHNALVASILSFGCELGDRDEKGNSCLLYAARSGNMEGLKFILDAGACPNLANEEGRTPLMEVCKSGFGSEVLGSLEILLAHGAHTHYEDDDDRTALDLAQASGYKEAFHLISNHNAELCADQLQENTPSVTIHSRSCRI